MAQCKCQLGAEYIFYSKSFKYWVYIQILTHFSLHVTPYSKMSAWWDSCEIYFFYICLLSDAW